MDEIQDTNRSTIGLLPGETIDNIFDHLHNDIPTLSASSLVWRTWLPSCRYHLFHTVRCNPLSSKRTVSHLHDWLLASPDIHAYIQTLTISAQDAVPPPRLYVEDVERVLPYIPSLRNLTLDGCWLCLYDVSVDVSFVSPTDAGRCLDTLMIVQCGTSYAFTILPLCRILGLFVEVDHLWIMSSIIKWNPDQVPPEFLILASPGARPPFPSASCADILANNHEFPWRTRTTLPPDRPIRPEEPRSAARAGADAGAMTHGPTWRTA